MAAAVLVAEGTDSQKRTEFQDTEGNRFYFFTNSFGGISLVSSCYCDGNFTGVCIDLLLSNPLSSALFSTMGIMQADFAIPYGMVAGLLIMLMVASLLLMLIITDRVKYIVPKSETLQ